MKNQMYQVIDKHTDYVVDEYASPIQANREVNKLESLYGHNRYRIEIVSIYSK